MNNEHNELRNREARLRRAAHKKGLTLEKGNNWLYGYKYSGYRLAIGEIKLVTVCSGYRPYEPYAFTIEEAEEYVSEY